MVSKLEIRKSHTLSIPTPPQLLGYQNASPAGELVTLSYPMLELQSAWDGAFEGILDDDQLTTVDDFCEIHHEQYEPEGSCTQCEAEDHSY